MIASMWVGNLMLVLLNLPLIGLWIRMLTIPYHLLFPAIIAFCCIGAFSVNNSTFDVFMMALFGLVGYALIKLDFEPAPRCSVSCSDRCSRRTCAARCCSAGATPRCS